MSRGLSQNVIDFKISSFDFLKFLFCLNWPLLHIQFYRIFYQIIHVLHASIEFSTCMALTLFLRCVCQKSHRIWSFFQLNVFIVADEVFENLQVKNWCYECNVFVRAKSLPSDRQRKGIRKTLNVPNPEVICYFFCSYFPPNHNFQAGKPFVEYLSLTITFSEALLSLP